MPRAAPAVRWRNPRDGGEILLSLTRMNKVRDIDALNYTITVEAGVIPTDVQTAAERAISIFRSASAAKAPPRLAKICQRMRAALACWYDRHGICARSRSRSTRRPIWND